MHSLVASFLLSQVFLTATATYHRKMIYPWTDDPKCNTTIPPSYVPKVALAKTPWSPNKDDPPLEYMKCDLDNMHFWGQKNEDAIIYHRFFKERPLARQGFFLEMGALDGVTYSNTMLYEYCLGWHGIMIEGNPHNFENLITRRPCTQNVWAVSCPPQQSYVIMNDRGAMAEIIASPVNAKKEFTMLAPCRTMSSVFKEYSVTHINFFSLDVEGHEAAVLSTINFDRVKIDVLITETNRLGYAESPGFKEKNDMVHKILTSAGMFLVPSHVKDLPECSAARKRLLGSKFQELEGSIIYVSKEFRDDVC